MLNHRQVKFVETYIETGNASLSYKKAGYAHKTRSAVDVSASQLLKNPKIAEVIKRLHEDMLKSSIIKKEAKRILLWEIAEKASGRLKDADGNTYPVDYRAAVGAINELNKMDGDHQEQKLKITSSGLMFDAEIPDPKDIEDATLIE